MYSLTQSQTQSRTLWCNISEWVTDFQSSQDTQSQWQGHPSYPRLVTLSDWQFTDTVSVQSWDKGKPKSTHMHNVQNSWLLNYQVIVSLTHTIGPSPRIFPSVAVLWLLLNREKIRVKLTKLTLAESLHSTPLQTPERWPTEKNPHWTCYVLSFSFTHLLVFCV